MNKKSLFFLLLLGASFQPSYAFQDQQTKPTVSESCPSDDENFAKLFEYFAVVFAIAGSLVMPSAMPLIPGIVNKWKWTDPMARWWRCTWISSAVFFLVIFLPPNLARVTPFFRTLGLSLFHWLGNIRLEYLDCDLRAVPKDYGFFFFARWNPGPDTLITYWWAQLTVYVTYLAIFSGIYIGVTRFLAFRRTERLAA